MPLPSSTDGSTSNTQRRRQPGGGDDYSRRKTLAGDMKGERALSVLPSLRGRREMIPWVKCWKGARVVFRQK